MRHCIYIYICLSSIKYNNNYILIVSPQENPTTFRTFLYKK